jgi:UDP-glucose 4-epimerase
MSRPRCLITGASGFIGRCLTSELNARGLPVRALVRDVDRALCLPREVEILSGDLLDQRLARAAVRDVDTLYHAAAKLHLSHPGPALIEEYRRVNVAGTRLWLDAARAARVRRFVFFSTISVYGPSAPQQLHAETDEARPDSLYAATKREAEACVLAARDERDGPFGTVLRLAAVYGRGMKGPYPRLVDALRRRHFIFVGRGDNRRTLIHLQDAVRGAILAAEHTDAAGRIYNVTDGRVHTMRAIVAAICAALRCAPPSSRVPTALARLGARAIDLPLRIMGKRTPCSALLDKWLEDTAVSGERMRAELGFDPQYDLLAGWQETLGDR